MGLGVNVSPAAAFLRNKEIDFRVRHTVTVLSVFVAKKKRDLENIQLAKIK